MEGASRKAEGREKGRGSRPTGKMGGRCMSPFIGGNRSQAANERSCSVEEAELRAQIRSYAAGRSSRLLREKETGGEKRGDKRVAERDAGVVWLKLRAS